MEGFTKDEEKIMRLLVLAHETFSDLDPYHPDHIHEWAASLHNMQRILAMRLVRRDHPELFPIKSRT